MSVNVNVRRKINVNGKEYASVDELPPDVRALYDSAMASPNKKVTVKKITINGVDVASTRTSTTTIAIVVLAVVAALVYAFFRAR
jgi:hypothetical protein